MLVINNKECVATEYKSSNKKSGHLNPTPGQAKNIIAHKRADMLAKLYKNFFLIKAEKINTQQEIAHQGLGKSILRIFKKE